MRRVSYQKVEQWNAVPDRIIFNEFVKAEILDVTELPTEYEEMPLDDEDDLPLALASLFYCDIEDSDCDGFMSD